MPALVNLISCSIIEKDWNGDVLWTWSYPSVSKSEKSYVTKKWNSCTIQNEVQSFVGARHNDVWIYIHTSEAFAANKLPRVKRCAVVLFAKDFNPNDYRELCRILSSVYCDSGEPPRVLKYYLSAFSEGSVNDTTKGMANIQKFNAQWQMNNNHAKKLIRTFELETILIYTALLLKKRIVVYHHSLVELFAWIEMFPTLMKHRKVTENLFPWVDLVKDELLELKNYTYYIAGCQDSSVSSKTELFDLLVNIPAREITVAPHAKGRNITFTCFKEVGALNTSKIESLTMTKAHKEIALFMVQLCQHDDESKADSIIDEIAEKTQDLLNQLKILATIGGSSAEGKERLCVKSIREQRDFPSAVENFFINLGVAENLFAP